jgi:hypothetical protein
MAAYFTMLAPVVLYMAAAPIRRELADAGLLDLATLRPDDFVRHLQDSMRRALARDPSSSLPESRLKRPTS